MSFSQEISQIKLEMMEQLKKMQVLPEIMNNLETSKSNSDLIQFIKKFQTRIIQSQSLEVDSNQRTLKLIQLKTNFKHFLKIILRNVWEQKMQNYIQKFEKQEQTIKSQDLHFIRSENAEENRKELQLISNELDFHERQKQKFKRNIDQWKRQLKEHN